MIHDSLAPLMLRNQKVGGKMYALNLCKSGCPKNARENSKRAVFGVHILISSFVWLASKFPVPLHAP